MILIVDDKRENILSLKTILEINGFEVDSAMSGEEALKKVLKNNYALIILDVQMPGMDGFEVAESISGLSRTKDIPIIFLSAVNTHKKFVTKGFESGAIDYLTKPVDPDILILKVRTFNRMYEQTAALNKAHKELKNTISELHLTLESIPQVAFTANAGGTIDFVNRYWYEYSPDMREFPKTPPGKTFEEIWTKIVENGQFYEGEIRLLHRASKEFIYHLFRAMPVSEDGRLIKWTGVLTNIHAQKMLNEILEKKVSERTQELLESTKKLEASNNDLQQFASVASHDLKEPLRKIHLFGSRIKDEMPENPRLAGFLEKIMNATNRMSTLVDDVLSFSRLSAADKFEPTDLSAIVHSVIEDLELPIAERHAQVNVSDMCTIEAVPGLIRQVFQNIISNALKFSSKGQQPVIDVDAHFVASPEYGAPKAQHGNFCRISIKDNGIGFDEKYLEKIFSLFQRLNTREEYEGTGIGLSIVKKIVQKHNGFVTARSSPGMGSEFIIFLPVKQPAAHHQ